MVGLRNASTVAEPEPGVVRRTQTPMYRGRSSPAARRYHGNRTPSGRPPHTVVIVRGKTAVLGEVTLAAFMVWLVVQSDQFPHPSLRRYALIAVTLAALAMRRYRPVATLGAVTALLVVTVIARAPASGLVLLLGALTYSAALHSPRRRPWFYASCVAGPVIVAGLVFDFAHAFRPEVLAAFAWVYGGAGVGDSFRMRRAYIAEVTERARLAELTRDELAHRRVLDERLRIARELHDVVAHHITVISVHAGAASHVLRDDPERVWPVLDRIRGAADTTLEEIKSVIGLLRDPNEVEGTEPPPGLNLLPDLLAGVGFPVTYRETGAPVPLPAMADLAAYRIVQEALTNAHRYGDGEATLTIGFRPGMVTIDVVNRIGRVRRRSGSGFGLIGMRERAAAAHGVISAAAGTDGMFRVHAELPLDTGNEEDE